MAQLLDSSNAYNEQKGDKFWIKFNVHQTGFYWVKYDGELETGVRYAVENNKLSAIDRFGILDDTYALYMASKQTMSSLLSLMNVYREESEYTILSRLITVSYKVVYLITEANPELSEDIKQFVIGLLQHSVEVKYDGELETGVRYAVENNKLSAIDRFGILDDTYAFYMASKQTMSSLLSLMNAYREEPEYTVLSHLITISYKVVYLITEANPELSEDIKKFVISLLQHSAERLGWVEKEGVSHLDAMLRGEIFSALAQFGHSITQDEGLKRFNAFLNDRNTTLLPPDTRHAAYISFMRAVYKSNRDGYESLLKIYKETDLWREKRRILRALASSPDPDIVLEALNFVLSSEVRNQDAVYGLQGISREGRDVAWKWLKENWDYISKMRGSSESSITSFISNIVSSFSSDEKIDEIEQFFASRVPPATLKSSLDQVRINVNLVKSIRSEGSLAEIVKELAYRKY